MKKLISCIMFVAMITTSCLGDMKDKAKQFRESANKQFGDQHFKTAIALIELHKLRFGEYPESMDSLKYTGDWDKNIRISVKYQKVDSGYNLDLVNGWIGKPSSLVYPADFWKGIGLQKSNLKK